MFQMSEKYVFKKVESKSVAWTHFLRDEMSREAAQCTKCQKILGCKGGSTRALLNHLKLHNIATTSNEDEEKQNENDGQTTGPVPKKSKIEDFFVVIDRKTIGFVVSRLAAADCISINTIVNSVEIQAGFKARNLKGSADSFYLVRKGITDTAAQVRCLIIESLKSQKAKGWRFSLTLDEWTAPGNSRYLNLNIHSQGVFYNLGKKNDNNKNRSKC